VDCVFVCDEVCK